jgi:hypothetical protein
VRQPEFVLATLLLIVVTFVGSMLPSAGSGPVSEGDSVLPDESFSIRAARTTAASVIKTTTSSAVIEKAHPILSLRASRLYPPQLSLRPAAPAYDLSPTESDSIRQ